MASTGLQLVGFILGVLSWIGMLVTCASPEWRQNSHAKTMIDKTIEYGGLWTQCRAFITGETHCSAYKTFIFGLPGVLQVCRALMIASITLGFVAILVTILGIKCTSIGNSNPRAKARAAMIGGLLFLVAAVLVGASVSYYAHAVTQEYYNPVVIENKPMHLRFEYGSALFIGWGTMVVGILGGVILFFTSIFVIMRLNVIERRGRLLVGTRKRGDNHQHRQHHLPLSQTQKNAHVRQVATKAHEEGVITKHRIAEHNSKAGPKNGHSHHATAHPNAVPRKHTRPTSNESSEERKRYSAENAQLRHSNLDQPDGNNKHHHHHHHHMHGSKSENILKSRSNEDYRATSRIENGDDANGGFGRKRPAKEYV